MRKNARNEEKILNDFNSKYIVNENGCWIWQSKCDKGGYARFRGILGSRNLCLAHRYAYEKFKGKIPKGMCVCHNCPNGDNRNCVNPEHLWIGNHLQNNRDKGIKGTQCKGITNGQHKLSENDVKEIKKRLINGEYGTDLSKEYDVSPGLIYHIKQARSWKYLLDKNEKNKLKKIKVHYSHKLTENDVRQIRKKYSSGERVTDIANEYGLTTTFVSRIKNRKAWKYIKD